MNVRLLIHMLVGFGLLCFGNVAYAQLSSGAQSLQTELEAMAQPIMVAALIIGVAAAYFSDDNSIGKKVGYGALFISLVLGAAQFVGLFGGGG